MTKTQTIEAWIGSYTNGFRQMDGKRDEYHIYSTALTVETEGEPVKGE